MDFRGLIGFLAPPARYTLRPWGPLATTMDSLATPMYQTMPLSAI